MRPGFKPSKQNLQRKETKSREPHQEPEEGLHYVLFSSFGFYTEMCLCVYVPTCMSRNVFLLTGQAFSKHSVCGGTKASEHGWGVVMCPVLTPQTWR